jgi:nucleoside-diphosphate-sugar epimerase
MKSKMKTNNYIIAPNDRILVTGGLGFIGRRVTAMLLEYGFTNIACLTRESCTSDEACNRLGGGSNNKRVEIIQGNLLSRDDCLKISNEAQVIYHLAAGRGEKSFPDAYANSVITTRNLLDSCRERGCLKRFVNVSSFAVYTNRDKPQGNLLDETCPVEKYSHLRGTAYCFAKTKQEELIADCYNEVPWVIIRPGVVYGPGNEQIHGRIGIGTFGIFLHLGGWNRIPLTYVDNCAEAIVMAGLIRGIEREIFNIIDDDLPSSWRFLRMYKKHVKRFPSLYVPHFVSYILCYLWEKYSSWSEGQLPDVYNRRGWHATWKQTIYTNKKLKDQIGWRQRVPTSEGLKRYFESCREKKDHA